MRKLSVFALVCLCVITARAQTPPQNFGASNGPPSATLPNSGVGTHWFDTVTNTEYVCSAVTLVNSQPTCSWTTIGGATSNPSSLNNIKFASQFAGGDCGAKINAADTVLGIKGGQIWVDHTCGTTWTTQPVLHNSLVFVDDFRANLSGLACPLLVSAGGIILQGLGLDNSNGSQIATWIDGTNCTAGLDVVSVLGTTPNRLAGVIIKDIFITGANNARYCLRFEKVDLLDVEQTEMNNCATANVYGVDSTGDFFKNDRFATIPANGLVLDWGTGQFTGSGLIFESQVCETGPQLTIQGSGSGQSFYGTTMQADGCGAGTWAGFVRVSGFDTNSAFAGAPTGGAGAPVGPGFYNLNVNVVNGGNPTQGADFLCNGTATNPPQDVTLVQPQDFGSSVSNIAFKSDNCKGLKIISGFSNGHSVATLNVTNNSYFAQMFAVTSLDTARTSGTTTGMVDIYEAVSGQEQHSNSIQSTLMLANQGTPCANGNIALSGGWGTTAAPTAAAGTGQTCQWTITSSGTGQATNATITWTLPNPLPAATTVCNAHFQGGTGMAALSGAGLFINQTTLSATAPVFTWAGLPVAGSTYLVQLQCGP
jgi:hypothetical protein